jgi:hypothetical protein
VLLNDRSDETVRTKVRALLTGLAAVPANGIARVLERGAIERAGAFPEADFVVAFAPGFYAGGALHGDLLTPATSKGTHGYLPEHPEMHAAFFLKGRSIEPQQLGVIDMRAIAPTLAALLGVDSPHAERPPLAISRRPE